MGKIEGTCADYKKVQGQVSLALDGDRTRSDLGGRDGGHLGIREGGGGEAKGRYYNEYQ